VLALVAVYEPGVEEPEEKPSLIALDRKTVTHILIQRDGRADIELQRGDDGNWLLLQPVILPADGYRIDALLRVTASKSLGSFPAEPEKLAEYSLSEPAVTLSLNRNTHIAFGSNTPLDHRRYVRLGDTVHLISDTLYYHLIGAFTTFVSKSPLPRGSAIAALQLPELNLQWQQNRWQVTPQPADYSADQVTQLLDAWRYASAIEVKPYDGQTGEVITLQPKDTEQPLQFLLTARDPDLVLARPELGIQYHLPAEAAAKMLQLPASGEIGDAGHEDTVN
jgi:hypothetical protein